MSFSPPIRRFSTSSATRQEDLINAYEAEEERVVNLLSRKLEQLREEKIELENVLEAESESHVNRLSRELSILRLAQQQQQQQAGSGSSSVNGTMSVSISPETRFGVRSFMSPPEPTFDAMLEALTRENEQLRNRLSTAEREYIRVHRLNEVYRQELIEHRRRLGLSLDNLIGLSSDPLAQPTHHRRESMSNTSSPTNSVIHYPTSSSINVSQPSTSNSGNTHHHTNGIPVPIPRQTSQIHRPIRHSMNMMNMSDISESNTPLSHSPSSDSPSPFPFSPVTTNPASYISMNTDITSPASSVSLNLHQNMVLAAMTGSQNLTYPSVPPPSLASSIGSPTTSMYISSGSGSGNGGNGVGIGGSGGQSPMEQHSRRNSVPQRTTTNLNVNTNMNTSAVGNGHGNGGVNGIGSSSNPGSTPRSRRVSVDRGGRIAETGVLLPRSRAASQSVATTVTSAATSTGQGSIFNRFRVIGGLKNALFDSEN